MTECVKEKAGQPQIQYCLQYKWKNHSRGHSDAIFLFRTLHLKVETVCFYHKLHSST